MNNSTFFDKKTFAELLKLAKGNRSQNEYAREANVSSAHMSRFINMINDKPPAPEIISRLAIKAHNNVSYGQLMIACGYIVEDELPATDNDSDNSKLDSPSDNEIASLSISPHEYREFQANMDKAYSQAIFSYLYESNYSWGTNSDALEATPVNKYVNLSLSLADSDYERWLFVYKYIRLPARHKNIAINYQFDTYGRLTTLTAARHDKITIVINNEVYYEQFLNNPPVNLNLNLYIMLVNTSSKEVIKEQQLASYNS